MPPHAINSRGRARRFCIQRNDPRSATENGHVRARRRAPNLTREQAGIRLRFALQKAKDSALAQGTKITQRSQLAYWTEFCDLFDVDMQDFGSLAPGQIHPSLDQIRNEEEVLSAFMAFVVACPRTGKAQNTANYAIQCISAVRSHYALMHGRRPAIREGNKTGGELRAVIRGFQRTHPAPKRIKLPILQQHLRGIKSGLDLQNNPLHKALWALWLTQWQGVLRSSDLIKRQRDARRPWEPDRETHRGRLSVDTAKDLQGRVIGPRWRLHLKPNKTDQAGERNTIKTFVIDKDPNALSAGQAIREMLRADPASERRLDQTPLFRNPATGKEITYEESHAALNRCMARAGYAQNTVGTHSLRIGGATAYANAGSGGYAVSGFMGLWTSESRDGYIHACAPRIDMAALEIGRAAAWEIAGRPGPVSQYASQQTNGNRS